MNFQINRSSSHFVTFHLKFHSIFNKKQYKASLKKYLESEQEYIQMFNLYYIYTMFR